MNKNFFAVLIFFSLFSATAQETLVTKDFLLGKFNYRTSADFSRLEKQYADKPVFLNSVVYAAFKEMHREAAKDGISLKVLSGTRNFEEQKYIWERKWERLKELVPNEKVLAILEFSSMPATSRHHWGTDIDLNYLENHFFEEGEGKAVYEWLVRNAAKFGFYQVYTTQELGRTGYKEEKWHWSYLPLASKFLDQYNQVIDYCEIDGFEGSDFAKEAFVISNYVNGIPKHLQNPLPVSILPKGIVYLDGEVE